MRDWPQILMLVDVGLGAAIGVVLHGHSRGRYNMLTYLFDACSILVVLYEGGFFRVWGVLP